MGSESSGADSGVRAPRGPGSGASLATVSFYWAHVSSFCCSLFSPGLSCSYSTPTLKQWEWQQLNQYKPKEWRGWVGAAGRRKQSPLAGLGDTQNRTVRYVER